MKDKCCCDFDKKSEKCINCRYEDSNRILQAKLMITECKAFYETFQMIENNLNNSKEKFNYDIIWDFPYVVNGAFAVEIAIKFLLVLANIDFPTGSKGHDLFKLYSLLKINKNTIKNDYKKILKLFNEEGYKSDEIIILNLKSFSKAFNDWRYAFSKKAVGYNGFFIVFVKTICNYAIKKSEILFADDEAEI